MDEKKTSVDKFVLDIVFIGYAPQVVIPVCQAANYLVENFLLVAYIHDE